MIAIPLQQTVNKLVKNKMYWLHMLSKIYDPTNIDTHSTGNWLLKRDNKVGMSNLNLFLLRHTNSAASASCCLGVLTTNTKAAGEKELK